MSLGSNGVDRVLLLRKIPMRLHRTNFCTSSACVAPSFVRQPNGSKCNQMVQNSAKHEFRVNGVDRVRLLRKIAMRHRGTKFCSSSARFAPSFVRQPNGPKCTQMVQNNENMSLGTNGVDRVRSLRKIPMQLRGTNFCTSSARFSQSFVRQPNGTKCTQMVRNATKHEFRDQWGGLCAIVVKKIRLDFVA